MSRHTMIESRLPLWLPAVSVARTEPKFSALDPASPAGEVQGAVDRLLGTTRGDPGRALMAAIDALDGAIAALGDRYREDPRSEDSLLARLTFSALAGTTRARHDMLPALRTATRVGPAGLATARQVLTACEPLLVLLMRDADDPMRVSVAYDEQFARHVSYLRARGWLRAQQGHEAADSVRRRLWLPASYQRWSDTWPATAHSAERDPKLMRIQELLDRLVRAPHDPAVMWVVQVLADLCAYAAPDRPTWFVDATYGLRILVLQAELRNSSYADVAYAACRLLDEPVMQCTVLATIDDSELARE